MKLTPEEKKQREIARWEREKAKPKVPGYLLYLAFVVAIVFIVDDLTSNINTQMQSVIASELFAPLVGEEFAVARMGAVSTIAMMAMLPGFLYRPLCDRFGRRPFLIINTIGMGLGTLIIGLATGIPAYLIGSFFIQFFVPHDMQSVYVQECAPAKHRAKAYSIVKSIAMLGTILIPILRRIFIPSTDLSNWRMVFLVPGIITIAVGIAAWFLVRESDVFIESRLKQLRMTEEEIAIAKAKKQDVQARGGLIKALKFGLRNKQLRWILLSTGFLMFGQITTMYYESTLSFGYAQQFLAQGMSLEEAKDAAVAFVTQALMLFSAGNALFQFFPGFLADKLGRKKTAVVMSATMLVSFLIYYFGASNGLNPYIVGFFCGATIGSYWYTVDLMWLIAAESTPTNLRASIASVVTMVSGAIFGNAMTLVTVLVNILGDASIGICTLATVIPGMLIGLIMMMFKVKETNGVDMATVGVE